jgi:integrase
MRQKPKKIKSGKRKIKRWSINQTKYLFPDEVKRLQVALVPRGFDHMHLNTNVRRDRLVIRFALSTGARASEILNVKKSDLNLFSRSVFIRGLKGSADRQMPLKKYFFLELLRYSKTFNDERLFPIKYHCLTQRIWPKFRPVRKKFHSLRHTFAIRLYHETKDINLVKTALGHRSLQNTMVYLEYHYMLEEMKRIMAVAI